MRGVRAVAVGVAVGLLLTPVSVHAFPGPTFAGMNGKIAFSDSDGIYTIDADGTDKTRLTRGNRFSAVWAPDGSMIAFVRSSTNLGGAVFVMNAGGTGKRRLTRYQKWIDYVIWSPNGTSLLYLRSRSTASGGDEAIIKKVRLDGTGDRRLTDWGSRAYSPAVSPNGRKIAFESNVDGDYEIYVMRSDGSHKTQLTSNTRFDGTADWARDGSRIAFVEAIPKGGGHAGDKGSQIIVMNADGTGATALTDGSRFDLQPSWSPDDSKILFSSTFLEGNTSVADIFVISPDGTGETRITNTPDPETGPIWSPDGAKIGYNVEKSGDPKTYIHLVDAGGTNPAEVPGTGRFGNYFSWQALPGT